MIRRLETLAKERIALAGAGTTVPVLDDAATEIEASMKTVTLVHTEFGIEVRCPDCDEKLDRVPTEAAAFNRTGEYLKHPCLAAVKAA